MKKKKICLIFRRVFLIKIKNDLSIIVLDREGKDGKRDRTDFSYKGFFNLTFLLLCIT